MKKFFLSLLSGTVIGVMSLGFLILFPQIQQTVLKEAGINFMSVRKLEFHFVYNATLIITASTLFIFIIWIIIDQGKEKHYSSN